MRWRALLRGLFPAHREYSLQHHDDKVHRGVVVVEQDDLVQRRRLETGLFDLENAPVLMLNRHAAPETRGPMPQCLMIATVFSRGTRNLAATLDFRVAKRVQNLRLASESLLSRFVAAPSMVALAVDSSCSPNTNPS